MKTLRSFIQWCPLYLLVMLTIIACYWENSLSITSFARSLLFIGTFVISGILTSKWISSNPSIFLTQTYYHEGLTHQAEKKTHHTGEEIYLEKRNL